MLKLSDKIFIAAVIMTGHLLTSGSHFLVSYIFAFHTIHEVLETRILENTRL